MGTDGSKRAYRMQGNTALNPLGLPVEKGGHANRLLVDGNTGKFSVAIAERGKFSVAIAERGKIKRSNCGTGEIQRSNCGTGKLNVAIAERGKLNIAMAELYVRPCPPPQKKYGKRGNPNTRLRRGVACTEQPREK